MTDTNEDYGFLQPLMDMFRAPQKSAHGPSLGGYIDRTDHYPIVTFRPQLPPLRAMARAPLSPDQMMTPPPEPPASGIVLQDPLPIPNNEITAPGIALHALVPQSVSTEDTRAPALPPLPPHAMHQPHPLMLALQRAHEETLRNRAMQAQETANDERLSEQTQANQQFALGADGVRPSPFDTMTLPELIGHIVRFAQSHQAATQKPENRFKQLMDSQSVAADQQRNLNLDLHPQDTTPRTDPATGWPIDPATNQPVAPLEWERMQREADQRQRDDEEAARRHTRMQPTSRGVRITRSF